MRRNSIGQSSQFLASCSEGCPEPLRCECGVCTVACTSDETCEGYAGNATCVLPPSEGGCQSTERSCDVPCTHDGICERLGGDVVCLVGRCRHQDADAGSWNVELPTCGPRTPIAGLCALAIEGFGGLNNEGTPLQGTIVAMGDAEVRLECFGSDNFGRAIPVAARPQEQPVAPQGTSWWRVDDGASVYAVALAAPGLEALDVTVGDSVSIRHGVGHCERPGPCGGQEWSMRIELDGESISVPPFESVQVGKSLFTNAGALTHHPEYMEPDETTEGTPGCKGEPRTNFIATRVDAL